MLLSDHSIPSHYHQIIHAAGKTIVFVIYMYSNWQDIPGCILVFEYAYLYLQKNKESNFKDVFTSAASQYQTSGTQDSIQKALQSVEVDKYKKSYMSQQNKTKLVEVITEVIVNHRMCKFLFKNKTDCVLIGTCQLRHCLLNGRGKPVVQCLFVFSLNYSASAWYKHSILYYIAECT